MTKAGDMVFVYGRIGVTTQQPLYPETRYTIFYHNEPKQRRSVLLRKGEFLPVEIHTGESEPTTMTYFDALDLATAVVDPLDDATVWMAHEVAHQASAQYKLVVGRIKP